MKKQVKNEVKSGLISYRKAKAKQIVDKANNLNDIFMELNISMNSLCSTSLNEKVTVQCMRCENLDQILIEKLFLLLQQNMQTLYEKSSWGWNSEMKKSEAFSSKSWLIICTICNSNNSNNNSIEFNEHAGFASFRFVREDEYPVLYCYEIQIYPQFRGMGIGRLIMSALWSIANASKMHRVILTVFKSNLQALKFFKKIGFCVDETDPSHFKGTSIVDYQILSKKTSVFNTNF